MGCAAVAMLATACSGKLATGAGDGGGGEADAQATSSSGASSGSSGASSSGIGSSSGTGSGSSGASGSSSGFPGDDGGGGTGFDAGPNCGAIPTLHPTPAGDIYCGPGADGGALDCLASAGEGMCCLGGMLSSSTYAPQMCSPNAMVGCDNGGGDGGLVQPIGIQCNQIADCTANGFAGATACCLQGSSGPMIVPGCGYAKVEGGSAIVCEGGNGATACAPGEFQICSSIADCPSGTTCTPGKWKIFQLGFCQ